MSLQGPRLRRLSTRREVSKAGRQGRVGWTFQPEGAGGGKHRGRKNTGAVLEILRSQLVSVLAEDVGVGSENG